ncbi:MAG TPA: ABC transporter substrate-binding protein, partial [Propionibacteriaceae bacterium]|nr:ABC transporter substrate-binding protein [Propionibacteriaceae bacterium]
MKPGGVRVAAALAGIALVATSVAACSSSSQVSTPSGPVTLTMTIWGGDTDKAVTQERLALAKAALPNITVDLVQISSDYDTKTQTMIAGGTAPDVMMVAEGVNVLSSKNQLVDQTA